MIQFNNAVTKFGKIILDELADENIFCWVAGGSVRDFFMGVKLDTDYDIFFPNDNEFTKAREYLINSGGEIKWESDNGCKFKYNGKIFDLVKKFFNNPQDTIDAFDFTVSMFAVDRITVYHGESSFIDLSKRQLMINKITYPASTLSRAFRYYKKGFTMCLGEMRKMIESIQDMPKTVEETKPVDVTDIVFDFTNLNQKNNDRATSTNQSENDFDTSFDNDNGAFFSGID